MTSIVLFKSRLTSCLIALAMSLSVTSCGIDDVEGISSNADELNISSDISNTFSTENTSDTNDIFKIPKVPNVVRDTTAINAYLMMSDTRLYSKTFVWNGAVNAVVGPETQNWNRPVSEKWGIGNRSPDVLPYAMTDPGFSGPHGESYGIEIEFGDTTVPPRSPNSKNVRFYTDFGQTGIIDSGVSRAEVHIRSTLDTLSVKEGTVVWIGWSEYFTHLDKSRVSTVFQFRNQPGELLLEKNGFTQNEIEALKVGGFTDGGPASAIETIPVDDDLHYHFAIRAGTPKNWIIPNDHKHTILTPIETGKWYDFVLQLKYSQNNDGRFRIWMHEASNGASYGLTDAPEWNYMGATMYDYPSGYNKVIPTPEFRYGIYRYNAKNATDITDQDRYMVKFAGPMRLWVGDSDEGFEKVKPR